MTTIDFHAWTEAGGTEVSREQVERLCHRYIWAARRCRGKDVIEAACGTGAGLGLLAGVSRSLRAGDFDQTNLSVVRQHCGDRVSAQRFDAQAMPFADASADVVVLCEAIYYLPDPSRFVTECRRVLRPGGEVLIATANKDLYDFNPGPHSHTYYGAADFADLFGPDFKVACFGHLSFADVSFRQRALRGVKRLAVKLDLMPKTQAGKKIFKKFVFGKLVTMPAEVRGDMIAYTEPPLLPPEQPDREHKVIYCAATKR
jgi:ubiquinone/menaquinone biosynthesis C-methylase UbiE